MSGGGVATAALLMTLEFSSHRPLARLNRKAWTWLEPWLREARSFTGREQGVQRRKRIAVAVDDLSLVSAAKANSSAKNFLIQLALRTRLRIVSESRN